MTSALLRRSAMVAKFGSTTVPLLTFDPFLKLDDKTAELKGTGHLGDGVHLRNCWHEVARMPDSDLRILHGRRAPAAAFEHATSLKPSAENDTRRTFLGADGNIRRIEHLRPDGSVFIREERDVNSNRTLALLDHEEAYLHSWTTVEGFYHSWLDCLIGDEAATIVNDDKFTGTLLRTYRRTHVRTVQVLHNSHLSIGASSPYGPFTKSRTHIIFGHEGFDGLAFLTERQKGDFLTAFSRRGHTFVIPNSRGIPPRKASTEHLRPAGAGVMLARLTRQKQVDHTTRALAQIHASVAKTIHIDVYGSGPDEDRISTLIEDQGMSDLITLRGYDPDASARLQKASFIVLSSRYEGLPLVLVEAMAAGCIPIAYDIRYGPSDVITHGVDGLLVPETDISALAQAISSLVTMDESKRAAMRLAAQKKARQFDDVAVTRLWSEAAAQLHAPAPSAPKPGTASTATRVAFHRSNGAANLHITGILHGEWPHDAFRLRLFAATRDQRYGFDVPAHTSSEGGEVRFSTLIPADRLSARRATYDFWVGFGGRSRRRRLAVAQRAVRADSHASLANGWGHLYATAHGNLSLKVEPASPPTADLWLF